MSILNLGYAQSTQAQTATNKAANAPGVAPRLDPNYLAELVVKRDGADYIRLSTPLPENFSLEMSSSYDRPFAQPASQIAGRAMQDMGMQQTGQVLSNPMVEQVSTMSTGITTQVKYLSAAVWSSGSVLGISMPFIMYAQSDPVKEVAEIELKLLQLAAPGELGGILTAPGPQIANAKAALDTVIAGATNGFFGENRLAEIGDIGGDNITLYLGKFLEIGPCIIRSVNVTHDTMFDNAGRPITAVINVTFETYFTTTKEDLAKFFRPILGEPTNANP